MTFPEHELPSEQPHFVESINRHLADRKINSKPRLLAVCHDCKKKHGITAFEILRTNAIRDWEIKHAGHLVEFLAPEAYEVSIARHAVHDYRHNADMKIAYAAETDYTITLASLAESPTLLTGRQSDDIDNTTNLYLDYEIAGRISVDNAPTTVGDEAIEVIAISSEDTTPNWPDQFGAIDAARSFTNDNIKNSIARYVARIQADDGTADLDYGFGKVSLAELFGTVPDFHVIWVGQSTGDTLRATVNVVTARPVYATVG